MKGAGESGLDSGRFGARKVWVHLASGIGNIVFATPLLQALDEMGLGVDLVIDADYPETADLLSGWSVVRNLVSPGRGPWKLREYDAVIPAIPPFYWSRFRQLYGSAPNLVPRPEDGLFYRNEQAYYLSFAKRLGFNAVRSPRPLLPISPDWDHGVHSGTVVLAPGCKTGEMAAKRWPHFDQLARHFQDVAIVGTHEDSQAYGGRPWVFPPHARNFLGRLGLRATAELLACAGLVIANDSGLAHVSSALGIPTLVIFGPTPDATLAPWPENTRILRTSHECAPCWLGHKFRACQGTISCLRELSTETVLETVEAMLGSN